VNDPKPFEPYDRHPLVTTPVVVTRPDSAWARSLRVDDVRPLIVCRGPIRKEALDVFAALGIEDAGILLSEKDSIVYQQALAPELRRVPAEHVHRVKDYSGADKAEREERTRQIVSICKEHGYTHVFAGYGFMAEDEAFVRTLEEAGLVFIGPRSSVQSAAGRKDEAKRTALAEKVSVTPGIDDVTSRVLLRKHPDLGALRALVNEHALPVSAESLREGASLAEAAKAVLDASYARRIDLYTIDELSAEIERALVQLFTAHPGNRVRLKAIGGGGGKGQRILTGAPKGSAPERVAACAAKAPAAVREILAEVKAAGVGDNKNILLELNVEETRHNEIQMLGNGRWCVSLGGRDCSLQMHEQKLLEVSITQEGLARAAERARAEGRDDEAKTLEVDRRTLERMEAEAERFGLAVGLDSAATFECIVEGENHYFMEVNTRIQVEHRVSELCYALRFASPQEPDDAIVVNSLVAAMVLVARHGDRLPRPERVLREGAALEARLNATDRSLSPHAGGLIHSWTDPLPYEIRDDQGICTKNPDTGIFVRYRLAGAYDSNIALLVTYGDDRRESYERLAEILRRTKMRGTDLATNLEFHYGLVHWFLARNVWAKPTTRFVVPYLCQVALLCQEGRELDLVHAWTRIVASRAACAGSPEAEKATRKILGLKETLLKRPLDALCAEPHVLSAWLSHLGNRSRIEGGRVRWLDNPLVVLWDLYKLLNMDEQPNAPAAHVIWEHDRELVDRGLAFYAALEARLGQPSWSELEALLAKAEPPSGFDAELWHEARAAHRGHQLGLEILDLLPLLADRTGFFELRVEEDLSITIPERLLDPELYGRAKKILAPPPATKANEIVAASGGMFYAREAPHMPRFVEKGSRFEAGDPLYIVEVMKMFNKVYAPFGGTIDELYIDDGDGVIVHKGQPLFRVTPKDAFVELDPVEVEKRRREKTESYLSAVLPST